MKIRLLTPILMIIAALLPRLSHAQDDYRYQPPPPGFVDLNPDRTIRKLQKDSLFGYYNYQTHAWVIEPKYTYIDGIYQPWLEVRNGDLRGIVDKKGNTVVPVEYEYVTKPTSQRLSTGSDTTWSPYFIAGKNRLYGVYNAQGKLVLPVEWGSAFWINDTLLHVSKPSVQLIFNSRLGKIFEGHFEEWNFLEEQGAYFHQKRFIYGRSPENGKMGLLDLYGKLVLPYEFNRFTWSYKNFICAETENRMYTIYNAQGRQLFPAKYNLIGPMIQPYFVARDGNSNKVGVLDTTGRVVVPFKYNSCNEAGRNAPFFMARYANEPWAIYDTSGRQLNDMIFMEIEWSGQVLLGKTSDEKWHFLDKNGQFQGPSFDDYKLKTLGIVITSNAAGDAFCSLDGHLLTDFKYKYAQVYYDMKTGKQLAKEKGVPNGKWIIGNARSADGKQVFIDNEGKEHF